MGESENGTNPQNKDLTTKSVWWGWTNQRIRAPIRGVISWELKDVVADGWNEIYI